MASVNKSAAIAAANSAEVQGALDVLAGRIAAAARAGAAGHGSLSADITVENVPGKRGVRDRLVVLDRPDGTYIEFGHVHNRNPDVWVPGLFVIRNAVAAVVGK